MVQSLTLRDSDSYFGKLTLVDGSRLTDPYTMWPREWHEDLTGLPRVEWPDIYTYLIESPSVYSREKLRAMWIILGDHSKDGTHTHKHTSIGVCLFNIYASYCAEGWRLFTYKTETC